jgi:hypothetical protein
VVPGIARRTVGTIAHRAARGGHITPRNAVRTLVRQTRRVLGTPAHRAQALRRHHHLERRFHGRGGPGIPHMHWRYGWRPGRRPGWRYGQRVRVPGRAVPGYARRVSGVYRTGPGAPAIGGRPVRYGRARGKQCPTCGTVLRQCCCCGRG